jgi:signal transduction histidine kinase
LLIITIPNGKLQISRKILVSLLFSTFFIMALTLFTSYVFSSVTINGGLVSPNPGPAVILFTLFEVVMTVALITTLFKRLHSLEGTQKLQVLFITVGMFLMLAFVIGSIVIPVTIFQNPVFVPLFPMYTLFFTGLSAYAIVKHKLFEVKVIATEAITVVIWVILFAKLFVTRSTLELALDAGVFVVLVIFGVVLIRSVINEVKQREELAELNDRLKAMDEQKDTFISMAAHELRAPMTAIKGYVSMILEGDAGDITDKARGYLADTNAINDRLVRLVNNMLNVSRIEEGRMVYQVEIVNLAEVVRTVFSQFRPEAERKGLELSSDVPMEIKDRVEVDPDRIQEVIGNFLSNAVKYTNEGSVMVKLRQPSENIVRLEVVDTGPGISKEEQAKLFNKFYRAESTVGKTIGTGLGLYISRLLIEKFGGKIGIDSEVGKGSIFWFELPVKPVTVSTLKK